ncbi:MAG TPA: hypothetical protein VMB79_03825 [Jatrophihabitans sp.]|nr:hypothetical protein [Jatrophihabitans sp.]
MPALLTRLLRDLRYRPAAVGWVCLELDANLAADPVRLAGVRELIVPGPGDLTLPVLAAAPRLAAVLLRGRWWPAPEVSAELDRRGIAVVRHLGPDGPPPRNTAP